MDWLVFAEEKWYREHCWHQLRVAMLADILLNWELLERSESCNLTVDELAVALWVSALLHDHGFLLSRWARIMPALFTTRTGGIGKYGREMFLLLLQCYEGLFSSLLTHAFCQMPEDTESVCKSDYALDKIGKRVRSFITDYLGEHRLGLGENTIKRIQEGLNMYDHGVWSALNLTCRLDQAGLPWHPEQDDTQLLKVIIEAISIHNLEDFCGNDFDIGKNPVAGLLLLADELQEWNRRAVPDHSAMDIGCTVYITRPLNGNMDVKFEYSDEDLTRAKWDIDAVRRWKVRSIRRLRRARGLPNIRVTVCSNKKFR